MHRVLPEKFMLKGNILTTDGWIHGTVRFENGRVTALEGHIADPLANDAPYILPGFNDGGGCHADVAFRFGQRAGAKKIAKTSGGRAL